jgi:hypothetical protein
MGVLTWWNDVEKGEVGQTFCLALFKANMLHCGIHAYCTLTDVSDPYHHVIASPHLLFQICAVTCLHNSSV